MKKIVNLLHKDLSYKLQGIAFDVRKNFGLGHKEQIYQKAFEEELKRINITYEREKAIKIYSPKDARFIGLYRPDFIIDKKIVVEIKTFRFVPKEEMRKIYDYLRNSEYELGYLINFASPQLYVKRIIFTNDKKNWFKKLLVSVSLWLVLFSGISFAQETEPVTIGVYPPVFELQLEKGQIYQNQILLRNKSDLAIPISTDILNFTASDEIGGIGFSDTPLNTTNINTNDHENISGASWFHIENPNFILEPEKSQRIKFKINVPNEAANGGYYVSVLFKSRLPSYYFEKDAVETLPQIGVLFLISVGKKGEANFEIVELNVSKEKRIKTLEKLLRNVLDSDDIIVDGSRLSFILRVKNNDIYHLKPSGDLTIVSGSDKIIGEVKVKETTILPGKVRQFPIEFRPYLFEKLDRFLPSSLANFISENFYSGKYKAVLKLHGSGEVEKVIDVWIFPWRFDIIILLAFSILCIIINYTKQKRKRTPKEILRRTTGQARNRHETIMKKKIVIDGIKK